MADNTSVFTEVLELQVQTSEFERGLQKIEDEYNAFISRMNAKGADGNTVLSIGGIGATNEQISQLASQIATLTSGMASNFGAMAEAITSTLEGVQGKIKSTAAVQKEANAEVVTSGEAAQKEYARQYDFMDERHRQALVEDRKLIADKEALAAKDAAYQSELMDKEALKRYELITQAEREMELYFLNKEKQLDKLAAKDAAYQSERADKEAQALDRMAMKDASIQQERLERENAAQVKQIEQAQREMELYFIKKAQREITEAERTAQKVIEITQQRDVELAKLRGKRMAEEEVAAVETAKQASGFTGGLRTGFRGGDELTSFGFGEMLGQVARFQLLWGAVGLAMDAAMAPLRAIVDGIKEGVNYLEDLEKKTYELSAVLGQNVRLSADIAQNFKDAATVAPIVVKALQDVADRTGLKEENLFTTFGAFAQNGGADTVRNLNEMVKLTEVLNLGMRGYRVDTETARKLISEIPSLLDGSISKHATILRLLGMSKDEAVAMVESSKKHHDLLDKLSTKLEPYLKATKDAQENTDVMASKVDRIKERWEAVLAAPFHDAYKKFLADVIDLSDQHGKQIDSWLTRFAAFDSSLAIKTLPHGGGPGTNLGASLFGLFVPQSLNNEELHLNLPTADFAAGLMQAPISDNKGGPPKDFDPAKLRELEEQWRKATAAAKAYFDEERRGFKDALTEGAIDHQNYHDNVLRSLGDEKSELAAINEGYKEKLRILSSDPKRTGIPLDRADVTGIAEENNLDRQRHQNEQEFRRFQQQMEQQAARDDIAMQRTILAEKLKDFATFGQQQQGIKERLEAEAREKEYQAELQLLNQELAVATTTEQRKAQIRATIAEVTFKREADAVRSKGQIEVGDLNDAVRIMREQSALAHATFNSEQARVQEGIKNKTNVREIVDDQKKLAVDYIKILDVDLARVDALKQEAKLVAEQTGDTKTLLELEKERQKIQEERTKTLPNTNESNAHDDFFETVFGKGIDSLKNVFDNGFAQGVNGLTHAFGFFANTIHGFIDAWKQGTAQGGTLGGIGGVLGQAGGVIGQFGPAGALIGGIMQGIGSVFSIIGGFFTAAARHIAEEIKKEFSKTVDELHAGTINLNQAIQQIEQERIDAINKLSGKKGGKDQLNQILPELDKELASLKQQQKDIFDSFEQQLNALSLHSNALSSFLQTWQQINKQVKDYLDAGGNAAKAAQYLSLQLEKQRQDAQQQLTDGQQQAVQDAINLNNLLKQRVDLIKQEAQSEFNLINGDAMERRESHAVVVGKQINQQREQFKQQIDDLNTQISLTSQKVSAEKQIFDIANTISGLHRQDEALQLAALQKQIANYKDLQKIIAGIQQNPDGSFSLGQGFGVTIGAIQVTVPASTNPNEFGNDVGDAITQTIRDNFRGGRQLYRDL
jgi:hypothetical protein